MTVQEIENKIAEEDGAEGHVISLFSREGSDTPHQDTLNNKGPEACMKIQVRKTDQSSRK